MKGTPFLIGVRDTLYDLSNDILQSHPGLSFVETETIDTPPYLTTTHTYVMNTSDNPRGQVYYRLYEISQNDIILQSYTVHFDSAAGGVRRYFNYDNIYEYNTIYDVNRAGIFMGNNENSIIRGNRIHGIEGNVVNEFNQSEDVDCAGILLGGLEQQGTDGFILLGTQVYKNEISNVSSNKSMSGISLRQNVLTEVLSSNRVRFPDYPERISIYSNIV